MKRTLLALAAATALSAAIAAPAPAAVETTQIQPAKLDRGANGSVPHVQGHELVVGQTRHDFGKRVVRYLGESGSDHVVETWREGRVDSDRIVRVTPDDVRTTVVTGLSFAVVSLSSDGEQLLYPHFRFRRDVTRTQVFSSHDGTTVASRRFRGYVSVLDALGGRAVLATDQPERTFWWDVAAGTTATITDRAGYRADVEHDLLAFFTKDPYLGGCSVLTTLSDPTTRLWRSCDQAVLDFSPSGDRVTTVYLLADGLGPGTIELHKTGGRLLARYATGFFQGQTWESDDTLLMLASGKEKTAWVRCTLGDCERTSRLTRTEV